MDLHSDNTFWPSLHSDVQYPVLTEDISCDLVIVGAGVFGALIAFYASEENISVVVLEKRRIGHGSTSASTALLLYDLDVNLADLIRQIGEERAVRAYRLALTSMRNLFALIEKENIPCSLKKKQSLYIATESKDEQSVIEEFTSRITHGFAAEYLDAKTVRSEYGMKSFGAILNPESGELDPYQLTQELLARAHRKGVKIYEETDVLSLKEGSEKVVVQLRSGYTVTASKVILATGYESQQYLSRPVVDLKSSYVIATKPMPELETHWIASNLVWEASRPYLYIRTTADHRLMIGGEDEDFRDPAKRDALLMKKSAKLQKKFEKLTNIRIAVDFSWAGTFGETKDGLGYVGVPPNFTNTVFALGFGGNGIVFGEQIAFMALAIARGREPPNADLLAFDRPQ